MNLAFLTPTGPLAESPIASATTAAGAVFVERDGWRVAARFDTLEAEAAVVSTTVGWADMSHIRKTEVGSDDMEHAFWISKDRALVLGVEADGLDITTQLAAVAVAGPLARELIARFCALDLRAHLAPPGTFLPGSIARTPGYVLVQEPDRFLLLFGAALALYVWAVVSDAGDHLGGKPVGAVVLSAIPSSCSSSEEGIANA